MGKITFTPEEVQQMIMEAFVKGENYGVAYAGWFVVTDEDRAQRAAKDCEAVYQKAIIAKI